MPLYEYECQECEERVEAFQKVSDQPLSDCPRCEGRLKRVFHPVGVVFKGSGFYATDYARKDAASAGGGAADRTGSEKSGGAPDGSPGGSSGAGGSGDGDGGPSSSSTPKAGASPASKRTSS